MHSCFLPLDKASQVPGYTHQVVAIDQCKLCAALGLVNFAQAGVILRLSPKRGGGREKLEGGAIREEGINIG